MTEASFLNAFGLFIMALMRFGAFFINIPVFGDTFIPNQHKVTIAAITALIILPSLVATQQMPELTIIGYAVMSVKEIFLGFALGYMVLIITSVLRMGGSIIGMQIGFSFVQVADPSSNQSMGLISEFFQLAGTLCFLIINGHLIMFNAFYRSFAMVPPGKIGFSGSIIEEIIKHTSMIFYCGIQLAMPIIAVILLGDVALGIIARTVPKMNIFQLGFALKILGGMVILMSVFPSLIDLIRGWLELSLTKVELILFALKKIALTGGS
jgi:flagellar biosynthetic protein FliR